MKGLTGAKLQAARQAAAERFENIARLYAPAGYTVEYCKGLTGWHSSDHKLIRAPRPVTRKALYIFLHECAHALLGHRHNRKVPRHVEEMQAEQWAHAKMREHGVTVPRVMTENARRYVALMIEQAERRGAKRIDPQARAFAKSRAPKLPGSGK